MKDLPPLGARWLVPGALVLLLAAGVRLGYLSTCCDLGAATPRLEVQGEGQASDVPTEIRTRGQTSATELQALIRNLREYRWFGGPAPLANTEEQTAHIAPGYPWLASWFANDSDLRRLNAGLSILTVLLLMLYVRHAFASNLAACLTGLLAALHPFWIINLGELADGTLVTCLLAAALFLGTHAVRNSGPLTSLLFGLSLAGLALVRASLLPFSFLGLAWFLLRCRLLRLGWFVGLLALLGFGNGLAPWLVRNLRLFQEPLPIVSSTYLHLWIGSMPGATGGPADEKALRASLPPERLEALLGEQNQAHRYAELGRDLVAQVRADPGTTLTLRLSAAIAFLLGDSRQREPTLVHQRPADASHAPPAWITEGAGAATAGSLLVLLLLGSLGWRWSARCAVECRLASLALVWLPIPFLLSHGEHGSGPRLPWEAPLILFAAYALACMIHSIFHPIDPPEPDPVEIAWRRT